MAPSLRSGEQGQGVRVTAHHPRRPRVACAASACAAPRGFAVLASALPRPAPCAVMDDSPSLPEPVCGLYPLRVEHALSLMKAVSNAHKDKTPGKEAALTPFLKHAKNRQEARHDYHDL